MEKLCIVSKTRLGADCGSDHELLIAKFRLTMKKPLDHSFRYDLDQIPYDYAMKVTNRFKGLGLIEHLKNYGGGLWHCIGGRNQDQSQKRNAKWQNGCLRSPHK